MRPSKTQQRDLPIDGWNLSVNQLSDTEIKARGAIVQFRAPGFLAFEKWNRFRGLANPSATSLFKLKN
jgi:hypothetical protein